MRTSRKGTEKPIEIFVALFIILAVGLVMLRLFQNQLQQKQEDIANVEQQQRINELRQDARLYCSQKCTEASNNRCSLSSLASLCMTYGTTAVDGGWIDLNMNQHRDLDEDAFGGVGVCEEAVPCSLLIDDCCGRAITPSSCLDIMLEHWVNIGFDPEQKNCTIKNRLVTGASSTCVPGDATFFWYNMSDRTGTSYQDYADGCS